MNKIIEKVNFAYKNCFPDKLEGHKELKDAFWNGYMCRIVDEEAQAIKDMKEAYKLTDDEAADLLGKHD